MTDSRAQDLRRFYKLLDDLERKVGGGRLLSRCDGRMDWPQRGVYFFREPGEERTATGPGPRIVRVGTHALKPGSRASLWKRLSQHKGTAKSGGGNHRSSIFRLLVGNALMRRDSLQCSSSGKGSSAPREVREREQFLEQAVSREIGAMPFLWLEIGDEPGTDSLRRVVERDEGERNLALQEHTRAIKNHIKELAKRDYDKLRTFLESFKSIGKSLESAQRSFSKAKGQLVDGRGNLIKRATELKNLRVSVRKDLPAEYTDMAESELIRQPGVVRQQLPETIQQQPAHEEH